MPHTQQPVFGKKSTCSFNHWSPLLSISNSLEVIVFTAFSVGELGNKSIKAWLSSKGCIRLGSSGIEPTKKKNYSFKSWKQDIARRLSSAKTDWFQCQIEHITSVRIVCNLQWPLVISLTQQRIWLTFLKLPANETFAFPNNILPCLFFFNTNIDKCNKWWKDHFPWNMILIAPYPSIPLPV